MLQMYKSKTICPIESITYYVFACSSNHSQPSVARRIFGALAPTNFSSAKAGFIPACAASESSGGSLRLRPRHGRDLLPPLRSRAGRKTKGGEAPPRGAGRNVPRLRSGRRINAMPDEGSPSLVFRKRQGRSPEGKLPCIFSKTKRVGIRRAYLFWVGSGASPREHKYLRPYRWHNLGRWALRGFALHSHTY